MYQSKQEWPVAQGQLLASLALPPAAAGAGTGASAGVGGDRVWRGQQLPLGNRQLALPGAAGGEGQRVPVLRAQGTAGSAGATVWAPVQDQDLAPEPPGEFVAPPSRHFLEKAASAML